MSKQQTHSTDPEHHVDAGRILGIETSCDETAAAVYDLQRGMLSNTLFSQIELHVPFGGVVPEVASRAHIEKIGPIVNQALVDAGCTLNTVDAIAVTTKPGLPGSLLVGLAFAKALCWSKAIPLIGVDHLHGHICSAFIEHMVPFPHLCLTASGGHTSIYLVEGPTTYSIVGSTIDDAAGEAFDKIAKMMNLPYPGGPVIEKLAREVDFVDAFSYPRNRRKTTDFSFSGLKTAVLYDLVNKDAYDLKNKRFLAQHDTELQQKVASSLLCAVTDIFKAKLKRALQEHPACTAITFVGGCARNRFMREQLVQFARNHGVQFFTPGAPYCTDNAAMIAYAARERFLARDFDPLTLDIF